MKTSWLVDQFIYDGTQLRPLFCYLQHGLLGNACVAWRGPCDVSFEHMVDGEDLLQKSQIAGSDMVHFVAEIFDLNLLGGVALQRLLTGIVRESLVALNPTQGLKILRDGDDLYWDGRKLSISVAAKATNSVLIHFAINFSTNGTPVPTAGLQELNILPEDLAKLVLNKFSAEFISIQEASWKVKPV